MAAKENIVQINIEEEMKTAYIDYSMSVIVSRALPDVRDGLKPVQRRVLFSMNDLGLSPGKPYKKSARIVGECFVAGTLVQTPKGVVPIEQLQIGDEVYTQNATRKVTQLYVMPKQPLWEVHAQEGLTKKKYKNKCTAGQLFKVLTPDLVMVWKKASELQVGDALVCKSPFLPKEIADTRPSNNSEVILKHNTQTVNSLKLKLQLKQLSFDVPHDYMVQWAKQGVAFCPVSFVQPTVAAVTYDIQVDTDHEFIANNMLVHNCLGKYHPHGDSSVYEAMVRMAQTWSLRYPVVDGQGNFGSMDGDSAAAMRYCVTGNTRIKTDQGLVPIKNIVRDAVTDTTYQANGKVLSAHQKTNTFSKFFHCGKHPIYHLQTQEGFELAGTANHPVWVVRKNEEGKPVHVWVLLENIQAGDQMVVDRSQIQLQQTRKVTKEEINLATILACLISEASRIVEVKGSVKQVPEFIFSAPKAAQKAFLQSLFEHDGVLSLLKRNTTNVQCSFYNHQLAKDIQLLLLEFGVIGQIIASEKGGYQIGINGYDNLLTFYKNVNFATTKATQLKYWIKEHSEQKIENRDYTTSSTLHPQRSTLHPPLSTFHNNYYYATVSHCVLQKEEQNVYSIKVDSDCHSFVANGFVNHNTEARLRRISSDMMIDIEKETVDFQLNFDDSLKEPTVLPARIPNLLINGASGIAVGMATNMLPHNLNEVIDGMMAYIDDPEIEIKDLTQYIKAPDFPTGGTIYGRSGVHQAFLTGRGRVVVRGKTEMETFGNNRERIIATEIPYQVNKATLIKRTADLVNEKKIEGISAIRDESDRRGLRIVYELKKDANSHVVLHQLYRSTALQSSYGVNNICLVNGRPRLLNIKQLITYFVDFRHEVVVRRTQYELRRAEERAHLLIGLLKALDHIDAIIKLIRASKNAEEARQELIATFDFSERQAKAILEMRLHRLTALERGKLQGNYDDLMSRIAHYQAVLASESMRMDIIKQELTEVQTKYGDARRTAIVENEEEITMEDIIDNEQVVVTISHRGYIKRTSLDEYREQNRGGKGSRATQTREEDFVEHLFMGSTHDYLLIFTERGKCHWLRIFHIPEGMKTTKGRAIQNLMNLPKEDAIKAYLPIRTENFTDAEFLASHSIIFCTKQGVIKKTSLEFFARPRRGGIVALGIREGDTLLEAKLTNGNCDVLLGTRYGRAVRFSEENVRNMGRTATGVRGITLHKSGRDEVVGMVTIQRGVQEAEDVQILSISEKGYGKRTALEEYRLINRGGKGVKSINVTEKTGGLIAIKDVIAGNGLMIINKSGIAIRMSVDNISLQGRATQGVRLINLKGADQIASVAKIVLREEEEEEESVDTIDTTDIDNAGIDNEDIDTTDTDTTDTAE